MGAEAVPITPAVARVHAELWASLAKEGNVIGQHDLWISATALTHGLVLAAVPDTAARAMVVIALAAGSAAMVIAVRRFLTATP